MSTPRSIATPSYAAATPASSPGAGLRAPETPSPSWRSTVMIGALLLTIVLAIFWNSLVALEKVWSVDPSYSHGYLVPLAAIGFAVLAWRRGRPELAAELSSREMIAGSAEILLGLVLHAVAFLMSLLLLDVIALICVLRGLLLLVGGRSVNAKFGFAALYLIFMAPLPAIWQQPLALGMQHFVSTISAAALEILGITAFRQGYIIQLTDYTIEVGDACSGLRQLTAIIALGIAVGEIYQSSTISRWLLAFLALPVAVGANCFRVTMTGVIMVFFGPQWAEGVFHTLEGLAVTILAAGALMAIAWGLGRLDERWQSRVDEGASR